MDYIVEKEVLFVKENLPQRKNIRLKNYNYNTPGTYFITICTKNREEILSTVGTGVLDGPHNNTTTFLKEYGKTVDKVINQINDFYNNINIDKYVIMPNHIHLLLQITDKSSGNIIIGGDTPTTTIIAKLISTFKRFSHSELGFNIWQNRSNDHIVRDEDDYLRIWQYIDENPAKWEDDCFYKPVD